MTQYWLRLSNTAVYRYRGFTGSSVPAALSGRRRQRVSDGLVRQLLSLGPGRLRRTGADVCWSEGRLDVRTFGWLSSRFHLSDGNNLADGAGGGQQMLGGVLARQVRRVLLNRSH